MPLTFGDLCHGVIPVVIATVSTQALILCPVSAAAQAYPQDAVMTAFVDVTVIPMDQERMLSAQTVLVQGDRITALGSSEHVRVPAGAVRIDGRGKFLLPGLADMHTHVAQHPTIADAERVLFLYVANGVTTIRNMDHVFPMPIFGDCGNLCPRLVGEDLLRLRARAAAGALWSPRIYTAGQWYAGRARAEDVPLDSVEHYLRAYQAAGYDFIKPYWEHGAVFDSLAVIGRRLGLTLQGHADRIPLEQALTTYKSIEHMYGYLIAKLDASHAYTKIQKLAAATKHAGVWNSPTWGLMIPIERGARAQNPLEVRYAQAEARYQWRVLGFSGAPPTMVYAGDSGKVRSVAQQISDYRISASFNLFLRELHRIGAGLLLGIDAPLGGIPGYSVHHGLLALVLTGLTPYEALATSTRNVAEFFGTLDSTGTVTVGKRADLLLVSANPLDDIRNSGQIAGVMVAGRWLPVAAIEQRLAAYYPDSSFPRRLPLSSTTPKSPE